MPDLEQIADEGFYRRVNIIPFEKKISLDEENAFDKNKILTQEAIDYFGNIALRAFLKIEDTRVLANHEENTSLLRKYRKSNNSIQTFLEDEEAIKEVFANSNIVKNTLMYGKYVGWCSDNNFFIRKRSDFYDQVLSSGDYRERKKRGYDCIENIKIKKEGLKKKPETF